MLTYDLQKRTGIPIYDYLYQCIRDDITSGKLAANEKLPSKRAFSRQLNVGIITVENAYAQLLLEGYIRSEERKGYFVEDISDYGETRRGAKAKEKNKTNISIGRRRDELAEPDLFMDFKANRISLEKFPASVWSRYMREALSLQDDILYKPVSYKGLYELRVSIADYLRRNRGMEVNPDHMIVGAGTEYLYGRLFQLLGRSCIFAMEEPGYTKIEKLCTGFGNIMEHIPIDDYGIDVEALEESDADVIHVSPANHFPTGIIMSAGRRGELMEWANKVHKRYIIEDDYDSEFRYNGRVILPLYAADSAQKVIYMNTFSKTLVPTLRISYIILPPKLMKKYEETMSFYSCTVSSFEQYALAHFIADGHYEKHINRMRKYYRSIREQVLHAIELSPLAAHSTVIERNAGTHFLLKVRTAQTKEEIQEQAKEQEVELSFYSEYGLHEEADGEYTLVINYASIIPEKIKDTIDRLCIIFKIK